MQDHLKLFLSIPKKIEELIENGEREIEVTQIKTKYKALVTSKDLYVLKLDKEVQEREIEKRKSFDSSNLNIKLAKFKGYNSPLDIYTFQDEFEKLYKKGTPSQLLPDLLRNNYLEGSALSLVKGVMEIDEIWKRLKDSFGDSKVMLAKKVAELSNIEQIGRIKDPSKM